MENVRESMTKANAKPRLQFKPANIHGEEFSERWREVVSEKMVHSDGVFRFTESNRKVINQLYYYMNYAEGYVGDPFKGILLVGEYGAGKTVIMETFVALFETLCEKIILTIDSREVPKLMEEGYYSKRPLYIDDMGKEPTDVNNYGTKSRPMEDLISARYKENTLTFASSNLMISDMPYNDHTKDRLSAMFTTLVMRDKSWR